LSSADDWLDAWLDARRVIQRVTALVEQGTIFDPDVPAYLDSIQERLKLGPGQLDDVTAAQLERLAEIVGAQTEILGG